VQVFASEGCSDACQSKVACTPAGPVIGSFGFGRFTLCTTNRRSFPLATDHSKIS
jgi:hypothetical protein